MTMPEKANAAEYLSLNTADPKAAAEYLIKHFGVMGTENFKEGAYNKFSTEIMDHLEAKILGEKEEAEETTETSDNVSIH